MTPQEKKQFVTDNYLTMTDEEMAKVVGTTAESIRSIRKRLGLRKVTNAQNSHLEPKVPPAPKPEVKSGLEFRHDGDIVINWTKKTVITDLGEFGEMKCSFDMHKAIQRNYVTMGENETAAIVAMKFDFPHAKAVHLYAKMHGFTKSSLPQTDLEFESGLTVEDAVKENIQTMKRDTYKKTERAKWAEIMKGYERWTNFHHNVLKPFENHIEEHISNRQPLKYTVPKGKQATYNVVVGMTDLHYLKLAVDDFGNITYDRDIARNKLFETQKDLLAQISLFGIPEKFTVIAGSDNIHIDNPIQTTTMGTNMANSTEGSWHCEIGNYIDMQLDYIDMFASIAPVDVIIVPGNHSKNTDFLVGSFLKKYYERVNKTVTVTQSLTSERTFVPYGEKFCLVFQHGDNVSPRKMDNELHKVILAEARNWGIKKIDTIFYHFSGHLHHEDVKDLGGNVMRIILPAVCPPDKWHTQSQYIGTVLQTLNVLIDKEKGRFATLYV